MMVTDAGHVFGSTSFMPMICFTVYDALGAAHARNNPSSAGGFSWLWDNSIRGGPKAELLKEGTYEDAVNVHAPLGRLYGLMRCHMEAITPWHGELDVGFLERCLKWYEDTINTLGEEVARLSFILVEPMHPATFQWGVTDADTAWPRARGRDILQIGVMFPGVDEGAEERSNEKLREMDAKGIEQIKKAAAEIPLGRRPSYPNYGDAAVGYKIAEVRQYFQCNRVTLTTILQVYGSDLPRLQEIKWKYDPQSVFMSAGLRIPPASTQATE
jgi:hypothetical protein